MSELVYYLQQLSEPLFPDIVWSRPENKHTAGKLLIAGGNVYGFAAPATAYQHAIKAGVGSVRIVMPIGLQKIVGHLPDTYFAPQNPSGSFSKQALDELLLHSHWADAVLLAGELGRNSETAITLEAFAKKYGGPLIITKDTVDYFLPQPLQLCQRQNTVIAVSMEQLQKIGIRTKQLQAITLKMTHTMVAAWLHQFTLDFTCVIITQHNGMLFVAYKGKVVSYATTDASKTWRVETAAWASVYWLQNLSKPLEAIATSFLK